MLQNGFLDLFIQHTRQSLIGHTIDVLVILLTDLLLILHDPCAIWG